MSTFLALRYVAFALFILLAGLTGSFAGLNFGFMTSGVVVPQDPIKALDMYLVVISALNVLFIVPIIGTELYRKGALTSRIWFELFWVCGFFMAYLGGAIAATMLIPNGVCRAAGSMKLACMTSTVLIAFTWITSALYLIYSFSLLAYCIIHSKPNFNIWNTTIVDHPWTPKPNSRSDTQSIDSRQTLTDAHVVPYKGYATDDSSIHEKDTLPVFSRNMAGPTTFGGAAASQNQRVGVNGAPAEQQGPHKFYRNPQADLESGNAEGHRQAPWSHDDETPSPAVIAHASRVPQPSLSLYPVHVVNAGLSTQSAHPATKPKPLEDLLRAAGLNHSATSLPYMKTSVGHGQDGADATSTISSPNSHFKSQSVDSVIQTYMTPRGTVKPSAGGRKSASEERGRRSRPRHRPPPLDLSSLGLSNIANADRR